MDFENQTANQQMDNQEQAAAQLKPGARKIGYGLTISIILISLFAGLAAGALGSFLVLRNGGALGSAQTQSQISKNTIINEDSAIIDVVKKASPAVVSIIVSKNLAQNQDDFFSNPFFLDPFFQNRQPQSGGSGSTLQQVAAGSGFFVSNDGLIMTNKHVVSDSTAKYTVITSDGKQYDATVVSQDPINDVAMVKIKIDKVPQSLSFGDSDQLQIGQRVIAIGNSLGQYSNTVTTGIVSGIGRNITAGDAGSSEQLEGVIQTDAAINPGNSGGPLLNVEGQVVGINTAIDQQGQLVGFAIPAKDLQNDLQSFQKTGKILKPFLGVQYVLITPAVQSDNKLKLDHGAWVTAVPGSNSPAVVPGSAADKAGVKEGDIIVSMNGKNIDQNTTLAGLIKNFNPGDIVTLGIFRDGKNLNLKVTLGQK